MHIGLTKKWYIIIEYTCKLQEPEARVFFNKLQKFHGIKIRFRHLGGA